MLYFSVFSVIGALFLVSVGLSVCVPRVSLLLTLCPKNLNCQNVYVYRGEQRSVKI